MQDQSARLEGRIRLLLSITIPLVALAIGLILGGGLLKPSPTAAPIVQASCPYAQYLPQGVEPTKCDHAWNGFQVEAFEVVARTDEDGFMHFTDALGAAMPRHDVVYEIDGIQLYAAVEVQDEYLVEVYWIDGVLEATFEYY